MAETPDTTTWKQQIAETPEAETKQGALTVAETPQPLTTTVAETPESTNAPKTSAIDWAPRHKEEDEESMEPLQLFPKPNKKRRVYSLGAGKLVSNGKPKLSKEQETEQQRRSSTQAVLTQARAFIRRKSLLEQEEN